MELTLAGAIEGALRDNLDIRIERHELDLDVLRIAAFKGACDPRIAFSMGESSTSTPSTSVLQAGRLEAETTASRTFGPTVAQQLATGGSLPLFNRTAHAELAQADVTRRQLEAHRMRPQQQIMVEVADAYETVLLQRKMLAVARQARELSQEQLQGETARFEVGFTTNFEVLRYQRDLDEARVRELRAHADCQMALARPQKAMGVSLDTHRLALARPSK